MMSKQDCTRESSAGSNINDEKIDKTTDWQIPRKMYAEIGKREGKEEGSKGR